MVFVCLYALELSVPGSTPATSSFFFSFATEGAGSTPAQVFFSFFITHRLDNALYFAIFHIASCIMQR